MLVLTRRTGETVMIGKEITVTVLDIKGGQARLGIQAPPSVTVDREEVYLRKQEEREGAPPR
jgi:carbon storage regulator